MIFAMILISGLASAFTGWLIYCELRSERSMFFGPADVVIMLADQYKVPRDPTTGSNDG